MQLIQSIQTRIYEVRGEKVMLDFDLASLYEVETRVLNQAVKRNIDRFPKDFMFQLSALEWDLLSSQIVMMDSSRIPDSDLIIIKQPKNRGGKYLPYVFTEQGIAMLSSILHSKKAISMNIDIMRAFVEIRRVLLKQPDLKLQLSEIKECLDMHDAQLIQLYEAIENLLDDKAIQRKWEERNRIGFRIGKE